MLLAFFVVMYAISSINEGKYRVLADALSSAFGGPPRTVAPIQLGLQQLRGSSFDRPSLVTPGSKAGPSSSTPINAPRMLQVLDMPTFGANPHKAPSATAMSVAAAEGRAGTQLHSIGRRIQEALSELVKQRLVTVRRSYNFLEVEIQSDILFASGAAAPSRTRRFPALDALAGTLVSIPSPARVEGHTDNQPITRHLPLQLGNSPPQRALRVSRIALRARAFPRYRPPVIGFGEYRPTETNDTVAGGRGTNRRVVIVILAGERARRLPQTPPTS